MDETDDSQDDVLALSFGRCVAVHRKAEGLSMARLASMAGMSRAYLWRVEEGKALPNLRNAARLSVALKMPLAKLLEDVDTSQVRMENRPYGEEPDD